MRGNELDEVKVVLLGAEKTGKSALLLRSVENNFSGRYEKTRGINCDCRMADRIQFKISDAASSTAIANPYYYKFADITLLLVRPDIKNTQYFKKLTGRIKGLCYIAISFDDRGYDSYSAEKIKSGVAAALGGDIVLEDKFFRFSARHNSGIDKMFQFLEKAYLYPNGLETPENETDSDNSPVDYDSDIPESACNPLLQLFSCFRCLCCWPCLLLGYCKQQKLSSPYLFCSSIGFLNKQGANFEQDIFNTKENPNYNSIN